MRAIPFCLILLASTGALAGEESYGPTPEETALLPPYCGGPGGGDWKAILGEARIWNNHTCYGINRLNRYYKSRTAGERNYHLQTALQDFNYSVDHLPQTFPLMPEILYYRGMTHKLRGTPALAMADWQKSISLDKHYVKSIQELADLLAKNLGKPEQALEVVTEGLRDNPGVKSLQQRYTRYGGKLPYPEPRVAIKPPQEGAPVAKGESEMAHAEKSDAEKAKATAPAADAARTDAPSQQPDMGKAKEPSAAAPVMGTSDNPWCRFCPVVPPSKGPGPSTPQDKPKAGQ
jgi:tetratricopeptide (TPR) repeat protein